MISGVKISLLPPVASSLLTDIFPVVQGGVTSKETVTQLLAIINSNITGFLPLTGGILTGPLILNANPTMALGAATKAYVDQFASGITVILSCAAATTANLNATQAGAGIGATLTNAGAMAAFAVDGYSASLNDRILVKNQTATQNNGVYSVTTLGSGAANWVLTRTTDYDTPAQIKPGTLVAVNNGTVNATTSWLETATVVTVDTSPVLFSQFTFSPSSFLLAANNLSDVANAATSRTNLGLTAIASASVPLGASLGGTGVVNSSTLTLGGNTVFSGSFTTTFTMTGNTTVTFPTTGTLITSAQPTINQPNIVGVTTGSNASAGSVGEFVSSVIAFGSSVSLPNNTAANVTSISLTAGDWDVWGNVLASYSGGHGVTMFGWVSSTSATLPDSSLTSGINGQQDSDIGMNVPMLRFNITITTTIYLSALLSFPSGTGSACGGIYARRIR